MSKARIGLHVEPLEGREVPATFGLPWGNAGHLTLSFAPDNTDVAGQKNTLEAEFAAHPTWQADILRAFQTWAARANINIAITPDGGQPFGAAGAGQNDARFGDIRIAAAPMSGESVSISAPHDPFLAGTWAGDMVFNSDMTFGAGGANLYAVALHEAGHILGLGHSLNRRSVMSSHLGTGPAALALSDVLNLRALYGNRAADRYEKGPYGNNYLGTATRMDLLTGDDDFDGDTPLAVFGDLRTARDVDNFAFVVNDEYAGPVTFRLQTVGVSLLNASLTVLDSAGRELGTVSSTELGGDVLKFTVPDARPGEKYYARVRAASNDVFGVGTYALAVTLDTRLGPDVTEERIDAVLRGPYRTLSQHDLAYLFEDPAYLVNADDGTNENTGSATRLQLPRGYRTATHFEYTASLAGPADVDTYAVRTPRWVRPGALTATVWSLTAEAPPTIRVTDRLGNAVPAEILANGNGTYTVQVTGARPARDYFVTLTGAAAGNYSLAIDLTKSGAGVTPFADGPLTPDQPNAGRALYVAQSQVFDFILSAQGPTGSVRMTILERVRKADGSDTHVTRYTLTAAAGQTVTGPGVFLKGGAYAVVFESLGGATGYVVRGAGLTVPIGPVTTDPSGQPIFTLPEAPPGQYVYPGDLLGYDPYLANLLVTVYEIPVDPLVPPPDYETTSPFWMADLY